MIHAFPGMGADRRMYPPPWDTLPQFLAHDWPSHKGEVTLAEISQRVCSDYDIRDGDTLIGASLGGMVACEITNIRKIHALYLVGSAVRREEVNTFLALLYPLADVAPIHWVQLSAGKIPTDLAQMFSKGNASFIRAMCAAVFKWEGSTILPAHTVRIHGRNDRIIPPPTKPDLFLEGGHLISMTHAYECVEFIRADQGRFQKE